MDNCFQLTQKILANSHFHSIISGESKKDKVETIINELKGFATYPAALVAPYSENLTWFLEEAAAQKLDL